MEMLEFDKESNESSLLSNGESDKKQDGNEQSDSTEVLSIIRLKDFSKMNKEQEDLNKSIIPSLNLSSAFKFKSSLTDMYFQSHDDTKRL